MEGSFAQATRFGLKRARWRGQWRVQILDDLIAIVQNIELLIAHAWPKPRVVLALTKTVKTSCGGGLARSRLLLSVRYRGLNLRQLATSC